MSVKVILGLPYLSDGPLTHTARALQAPVLLSANSFSTWRDEGPAPKGYEVGRLEAMMRMKKGEKPPFATNRPQRMREWTGWNLRQMKVASGLGEIWLDSAGFHAMAEWGGYPWGPRDYIEGLCAKHPFHRFSSMDLCVEEEVAGDRDAVRERISRTVALNRDCRILSDDAGIGDRLMHVIQGANADDYMTCFEAMHHMIGDEAIIGVGSMCRRKTGGTDGIVSTIESLDRRLPAGVKLHLFGLKSDGAECVAMLHHRVASIDSQAYGVRARREANDRRRQTPGFSKSNQFVAGIMEAWYLGQTARMARSADKPFQAVFPMPSQPPAPLRTVWDGLLSWARSQNNWQIESNQLDHDDMLSDMALLEVAQMLMDGLPDGVGTFDPFAGLHQMPPCIALNHDCIPERLLHRSLIATDDEFDNALEAWDIAA